MGMITNERAKEITEKYFKGQEDRIENDMKNFKKDYIEMLKFTKWFQQQCYDIYTEKQNS